MLKQVFEFDPHEWKTPNTYDSNYSTPPEAPGIYLLVVLDFDFLNNTTSYSIKYVGSAKNLRARYERHEVRRFLKLHHRYVNFYFREENNYRDVEKSLIKAIQPEYNRQWR